ncbi:hypothetical protein [Paraburkholderia sp.]|jgi:hypothetical protein|uniref:hypothetical protein n=1 Tax=Paraburkholderia sp. TaxID=1926495 RepID=UPI002F3EAAB7
MKIKLLVALLVALSTSAAAPAFAGGYGPAPFYKPSIGAPASQRGQNTQTVAAERGDAAGSQEGYGGVVSGAFQAGGRGVGAPRGNLFAHH